MKNIYYHICLIVYIISVLTVSAQEDFIFSGIIVDIHTDEPLQNVKIYRIYDSDTIISHSNLKGEFQISLKTGTRLLLKKSGYAWHIVNVTRDMKQIKLTPSKKLSHNFNNFNIAGEKQDENMVDIFFDGKLIPRAQWDDAISMDKDLIKNVKVMHSRINKDGRSKIYFESK